jgi:hypothetical protein
MEQKEPAHDAKHVLVPLLLLKALQTDLPGARTYVLELQSGRSATLAFLGEYAGVLGFAASADPVGRRKRSLCLFKETHCPCGQQAPVLLSGLLLWCAVRKHRNLLPVSNKHRTRSWHSALGL